MRMSASGRKRGFSVPERYSNALRKKVGKRHCAREIISEEVPAWAKRDALVSRLRGRAQTEYDGRDRDPWNVEEREQLCGDS